MGAIEITHVMFTLALDTLAHMINYSNKDIMGYNQH